MTDLIHVDHVTKVFRRGSEVVHALEDIDLQLEGGEIAALVGPSGSGKTTLLYLLSGWETADTGRVHWNVAGGDPADAPWGRLALVPQSLGLAEELTVRENVELPLRLKGELDAGSARVTELMSRLDLEALADRYPLETSLGEQQRVAVARALVLSPDLLLADEPTSHQDDSRAAAVFALIGELAGAGSCCVVATHDRDIARYVDRVIEMRDGRIDEARRGQAARGDRALWGPPPS
ncbi:MAG TPA: ABC transporter ATP-binding protein [Actinomycetota bacterium]|nr:ABC transporter ATP-binding protein [Actinomycetota bacterium]